MFRGRLPSIRITLVRQNGRRLLDGQQRKQFEELIGELSKGENLLSAYSRLDTASAKSGGY